MNAESLSPTSIVTRFCAAWDTKDVETIMALLAPDCFFHNLPIEPIIGHDAIRPVVAGFMQLADTVRFELLTVAESAEGTVLVERVDRFVINGKELALPVMGAFEIENGLIVRWRDYYDQKTLDDLLASAGVGGVLPE